MVRREFAERFAEDWVAAWNAHDLPRLMTHYEDDFEMSSPRIAKIAGEPSGVLRGKDRVMAYWMAALEATPGLRFSLLGIFVGARSVAVHFRNQDDRLVIETFEFSANDKVIRAMAHYA